jgi:hypothetical protein
MNPTQVCNDLMNNIIAHGFKFQVTRKDLETEIMKVRGIDPRTVNNWIKCLCKLEYLVQLSPLVFRVNPLRCSDIFEVLKETHQTKLL